MVRQLLLSALLLVAGSATLPAQAPRITPSGDPSVRADSIYALAVDPAEYKAYGSVLLFDDGVMQIERSGTTRRTFRTVVQVLKQDAAETWGEWSLDYRPDRERITLNWARVLRTDGTVLSERPEVDHVTEESVDENHVYSGRMVRQLTLGGVAAGTIVDLSYTLETYRPTLSGDLYERSYVSHFTPVRRLRFIVDAPAHQAIRIETPNLTLSPTIVEHGGRTIHTWTGQDLPALEVESYAGYPNDVYQEIRVWGWDQWSEVGDWYARLSQDRDISPVVARAFAAVAGDTTEVDSLLRIAQRWVAQDFRYVSIGLGDGNYQPRLPSEVVQSRFGDCKDKATLFIALARSMGVTAYPVLVNSAGLRDSTPVSLERFNHAIVALERHTKLTFLDLTDDLLPFGRIPRGLQGSYGLLVRPNGQSRWVRLPESPLEENSFAVTITGTLGADATFRGSLELQGEGNSQYTIRERLRGATRMANQRILETAANLATEFLPGALVDSTTFNDGLSLTRRAFIYARLTTDRMVQPAGRRYLLRLPPRAFDPVSRIAEIGDHPRRFPIDAERLNDASTARLTMEVVLPPGWRAELPPSVSVDGLFGQYHSTYTQKGRTLRVVREIAGRWGNEPADSVGALLAWLHAVAEDGAESILLDPAGALSRPDSTNPFGVPTNDTSLVQVRFGWPTGMEAKVESEQTMIQQEGADAPTTKVTRTSSRLRVGDHPEGRVVSFSDWESESPLDTALVGMAERMASDEFLAGLTPSFIVSGDGKLLRLEGFELIRQLVDSMVRPLFDTLPNPTAARAAFLDRLLSEEFFLAKEQEQWNSLVWSWSNGDFAVGAVYEQDTRLPSPILPEVKIPYHYESSLLSRVPCEEGARDSACVSLVMRLVPDPKVFAPMVLRILRETMAIPDSLLMGWRMQVEYVNRLVTEPATLIPHQLEMRRTIALTRPDSAGTEPIATRQTQIRRFVYRYGDPPPPPQVDGTRLRLARDSFAVYLVKGADTSRVATAVDQLRSDGTRLTRVYRQTDTSGTVVDTIVARRSDLRPLSESLHSASLTEQLRFGTDSASVWVKRAAGDTVRLQVPLPTPVYDIGMFDVVVRAADLNDSTHFATPTFSSTGSIGRAEGRVTGSARIDGRDCWVFSGFNGDFHVTFWIDKASRTLRRSFMGGDASSGMLLVHLTP